MSLTDLLRKKKKKRQFGNWIMATENEVVFLHEETDSVLHLMLLQKSPW